MIAVRITKSPDWTKDTALHCYLYTAEQFSEKITILEQLASPHIAWYTHKNPFGCWICDILVLLRRAEELIYTSKSQLDSMNADSSQEIRNQDG